METPILLSEADVQAIWETDLQVLGCLDCRVAHLVPNDWTWTRCPACLAESLEPQPARLRPEPPEMLVPFSATVNPTSLAQGFSAWLRGVWLRPADLEVEHLLARLRRVYFPSWLVDGKVIGTWRAQMGFDYQVESSEERFDEDRGWRSRRLTETRVRWEPRVGRLQRIYHNLSAPALEASAGAALTAHLGHYDLGGAMAYTPAAIRDAAVRVPGLLPEEAAPLARTAFDRAAAADCQRAAGAQHLDEFVLQADYRDLNWTQMLKPLYVTYYEDDAGQIIPVWINGQSGHIAGVRRASLRKGWLLTGVVALMALSALTVGGLLALLEVEALAVLLMGVGFSLIVAAALPIWWAWQFNQRP